VYLINLRRFVGTTFRNGIQCCGKYEIREILLRCRFLVTLTLNANCSRCVALLFVLAISGVQPHPYHVPLSPGEKCDVPLVRRIIIGIIGTCLQLQIKSFLSSHVTTKKNLQSYYLIFCICFTSTNLSTSDYNCNYNYYIMITYK
jgi:hypothetical protein